ncbi:MAG TPA: hypothetical protein VKC34_18435 [Blastocatellia bacterium]|nr:hypothetical protein [Blastocatellia bacterium]
MICHNCKTEIKIEGYISRTDSCGKCGEDVHSCLNCLNYDPAAHNKCREPHAEWVPDREKANFCDLFAPNKQAAGAGPGKPATDSRNAFDSLFKK